MEWIDISLPLHNDMVHWPGDPPFSINAVKSLDRGDSSNLSLVRMGTHTGTHVDAPRHFLHDGPAVSEAPLDILIGPARVIEIQDTHLITADELSNQNVRRDERLLFRTGNSVFYEDKDTFRQDFVSISQDAADYLVSQGVKLVGVDYLSVGAYHADGAAIHRTLLTSGIWIIEGLDISSIKAGNYHLVCLPLKILDGDGAPARAVVSRMKE
jgi:arylformamidase